MERLVSVEFGLSRSKRFGRAVAEAESGPGECTEVETGRYRVMFRLGLDAAAYTGLARLLERVRHWRSTDVYEDDGPVSVFHAKDIEIAGCPKLRQLREPCTDAPDRLAFDEGGTLMWHPIRPICAIG
jgi:hypothetical protein